MYRYVRGLMHQLIQLPLLTAQETDPQRKLLNQDHTSLELLVYLLSFGTMRITSEKFLNFLSFFKIQSMKHYINKYRRSFQYIL